MDTKDLLAQAVVALEAERAASMQAVASLQAQLDAANATIAGLQGTVSIAPGTLANGPLQAAIDKALAGQTIRVPAGDYLLDALNPVMLKGGVTYDFTGARFAIVPNSAPRYYGMRTQGAGGKIIGGEIVGDRLKHTYTSGSTHEWGYGLMLSDDGWLAEGMTARQCTGDGAGVAGNNVTLRNCLLTENRRQGASVFTSTGFRAEGCEFSYTGAFQTDSAAPKGPCAGVDIEPDSGMVTDAVFDGCTFKNNRVGFEAWMRNGVAGGITGVVLRNCTFDTNPNHVWACDEDGSGPVEVKVVNCRFLNLGSGACVKADSGSVVTVGGKQDEANTFRNGATLKQGIATQYDIQGSGQKVVGWNWWP